MTEQECFQLLQEKLEEKMGNPNNWDKFLDDKRIILDCAEAR